MDKVDRVDEEGFTVPHSAFVEPGYSDSAVRRSRNEVCVCLHLFTCLFCLLYMHQKSQRRNFLFRLYLSSQIRHSIIESESLVDHSTVSSSLPRSPKKKLIMTPFFLPWKASENLQGSPRWTSDTLHTCVCSMQGVKSQTSLANCNYYSNSGDLVILRATV